VAARRPAAGQKPEAVERRPIAGNPIREEVVDNRIQAVLGWIPRLEQVVVEANLVDRADRDIGVRVRGQEDALRGGLQRNGLAQELDPGHPGHPLVDDEGRDRISAPRELAHELQRLRARTGRHDPVVRRVAVAQVALDGAQHRRVVVDGQNRRRRHHAASVRPGGAAAAARSGGSALPVRSRRWIPQC
jgi:hypothetical protein